MATAIAPVGSGSRSAICDAPSRLAISEGVGTLGVFLTEECPTAVLHIISTLNTSASGSEDASWTATYETRRTVIGANNIELGVNRLGGVIGGDIGLRRRGDPDTEVLAHGCDCEGWGIGNATDNGSVFGEHADEGLEVVSFESDGVTATSVSTMDDGSSTLSVVHHFEPSSSPDLYKVEVSVTNMSWLSCDDPINGCARNLRYRRVFDWDVNPTPFDEYATWEQGPGGDDSYITYTSNDGFANPSPRAPLTHLGSEGYFVDAGPKDQGGLIEISLPDLENFETHTFVFYYGAATSEANAAIAVDTVGADAYSLGQPNLPGANLTGEPVTAIFAIDSDNAQSQNAARTTATDLAPKAEKPTSGGEERVSGRRGRNKQERKP